MEDLFLLLLCAVAMEQQRELVQVHRPPLGLVRPVHEWTLVLRRLNCCITALALKPRLFGRLRALLLRAALVLGWEHRRGQ